jgi:hypothetical protein
MAHRPGDKPVVGLFEDGSGADKAAQDIRASGIQARVTSGTDAAEGRLGRNVGRGLLVGALVALPIAIVLPLIVSVWIGAGAGSLLLAFPILFVGAFLGAMNQSARRDGKSLWMRSRAKLVVTEPALDPPASGQATTIIKEAGGDTIQTPKPDK